MKETMNRDCDPVVVLADEYVERRRRGEDATVEEYVTQHPNWAERIRELFPPPEEIDDFQNETETRASTSVKYQNLGDLKVERIGDFRILREIARGGMGVVYEAEQISLGRRVALKVLPKQLLVDARCKHRFEREARSAARLHHTNIVPVFGVGKQDDVHYYVMQFIQGLGLHEIIAELRLSRLGKQASHVVGELPASRSDVSATEMAQALMKDGFAHELADGPEGTLSDSEFGGRLSSSLPRSSSSVLTSGSNPDSLHGMARRRTYWQRIADVGNQAADALEYAHQNGVEHRDVKPSNLLLDTRGTVWVTDFGLAKANDQHDLTHTGDILGTLRYMAPEAFDGKSDPRSDIYSLGLTLYELLALSPAFVERDRGRLIKQVTTETPPRLDKVNAEVPRDLVTIIHKAIEREPLHRYQSAGELRDDLRRFVEDEPIQARRASAAEKFSRWARHNKALAASLTTIALLLLAGSIGSAAAAIHFRNLELKQKEFANRNAALAQGNERERDNAIKAQRDAERQKTIALESQAKALEHAQQTRRILYAADMNLARQAIEASNIGRALRLLDRQRPQPGEQDLRDWEWRYSWQLTRGDELFAIGPLDHHVFSLDISSDNRVLVAAEFYGRTSLWDIESRQQIGLLLEETGNLGIVRFSPQGDMLAASDGRRIHLWQWPSQNELPPLELPGGDIDGAADADTSIRSICFSADGRRLAAYCKLPTQDNNVCVWDLSSKQLVQTFPAQRLTSHHGIACLSPDGKTLFVGGREDGRIYVYDVDSGEKQFEFPAHEDGITALALSQDGKLLASGAGYSDHSIRLWKAKDGARVRQLTGHTSWICWLEFSPDGKTLASSSADQSARLWDLDQFEPVKTIRGHLDEVYSLGFFNGSASLITGCKDGTIHVSSTATRVETTPYLNRQVSGRLVEFTPDGAALACVNEQQELVLLDSDTLEERKNLGPALGAANQAIFSPNGRHLIIQVTEIGIRVYDRIEEKFLAPLADAELLGRMEDGRTLAVRSGADVQYWNSDTWRLDKSITLEQPRDLELLSPDNRTIVSQLEHGKLETWKLSDKGELRERHVFRAHKRYITGFSFSPDGALLGTSGEDGWTYLWDTDTWESVFSLRGHLKAVHGISFSPDGRRVATGGGDLDAVVLWDVPTGQQVWTLTAKGVLFDSIRFSPDGRSILGVNGEEILHLWRAPTLAEIELQETNFR